MSDQVGRKYFGTDGIRGRVGEGQIQPEFVLRLGWAVGRVLGNGQGEVVVGKDTRISGYMLESAIEAGLSAAGVDVRLLGPMPTPAIAYLTQTLRARAGVVISASHNPFYDNGIKFFSGKGSKLTDQEEMEIERLLEEPIQTVPAADLGKARRLEDAAGRYIEFCKSTIGSGVRLNGLKMVVDCAHGATYHIAASVFEELGAHVASIGASPDGLNINSGCGATHPETLRAKVMATGADVGVALDGDGDRVIMVDEHGQIIDGDEILYIIAKSRQEQGLLIPPVVGTVMSNFGLEQAFSKQGISFIRAKVGDRYVMEQLHAHGGLLGGESSGHIICLDKTTTGDGLVSALQVLEVLSRTGKTLSQLCTGMVKLPQKLVNVQLPEGVETMNDGKVGGFVKSVEEALAGSGRVLLRASGTEPVIRVMVEGENEADVEKYANQLAGQIRETLAN